MEKIRISPVLPLSFTELYIGEEILFNEVVEFLFALEKRIIIIADRKIEELYAGTLAEKTAAELLFVEVCARGKTAEAANQLMDQLFAMGADRETVLVACGGGVTTDLVGFIASIYMRGVALILIPTTLLACVDAAIGGKTGIDTPYGKNQIGTLYHPQAIFLDFKTLQTLPQKEWLNGIAEIVKLGLVLDPGILPLIEGTIVPHNVNKLLLRRAIEGKVRVITGDPSEHGVRRILNFGHTIGHALETLSEYRLSHGEAVAIGSVAASHLSYSLGYLSRSALYEIEKIYHPFSLKLPRNYDRGTLFDLLVHDKKNRDGEMRFVLIDEIGHALPFGGNYCISVTRAELAPTLDWMEAEYS
jgi:3-dehydroquinate synthase